MQPSIFGQKTKVLHFYHYHSRKMLASSEVLQFQPPPISFRHPYFDVLQHLPGCSLGTYIYALSACICSVSSCVVTLDDQVDRPFTKSKHWGFLPMTGVPDAPGFGVAGWW